MILESVKKLCKEKGISVSELENSIGMGNRSMYNWTKVSPSVDKVEAVADYFGVSVDYILGRTDVPSLEQTQAASSRRPYANSTLMAQEETLIDLVQDLNEEGRDRLISYAGDLVASGRYPLLGNTAALEPRP